MDILQKQDLAAASFANDNTNAAGGLTVRTDAGSTVGAAITAATTCPAPMTRAALLALRTAGTLKPSCPYVITDFVQGQFFAGTTIVMHADSATELSMEATINSLYDNSGWACRYDIDTNNLTMVADNLDNIVESTVAGRVAAFDWGNTAYSGNRIQGSLTLTIGATQPFIGNTIPRNSSAVLTGRTGGSITDTHVKGQLFLADSNLTITRSNIDTNSSITATGYVAGGTGVLNCILTGSSGVVFGPGSGVVYMVSTQVTNGSGTAISHTGTGALTLSNMQLENTAQITHSSTGALLVGGSKVHGTATRINHTLGSGALNITGSEIGPYGRILKDNAASTGATLVDYCRVSAGGYVFAQGANTLTVSSTNIATACGVSTAVGSDTATNIQFCEFTSGANGSASVLATSTGGTFSMTYSNCSNGGFTQKTGTGNLNISQCMFQGTGRVVHAGARALTVTSSTFSDRFIFTHNSTTVGDVPDSITNCNFSAGGAVNMTATGAVANQMATCDISQSSTVGIGGTTTGAVITTLKLSGGSIASFNNNTAAMPLCVSNDITATSTLTVTGNTAAKDIRNNTVRNTSTLSITGNTVAANVHGNDISALGQLQLTAAAGNTRFNSVSQGFVQSSGGTLEYSNKTLASTWNTDVFNVSECIHETNAATTLTADNTARATRLGVTNTLPLI
jgi:hypothetical protein